MIVIGITGRKGSGKDTIGDLFIKNGFLRIKFADCLKAMIKTMLLTAGCDPDTADDYINGPDKETPLDILGGKTVRWAMQSLGTEWGRQLITENLWANLTEAAIKAWNHNVVVTDVRFPNEVDVIKRLGGKMLRVVRKEAMKPATHASEQFIDDLEVDWVIPNNGTIDELHLKVMPLLS